MKYDIYAEFLKDEKLNEKFGSWVESRWKLVKGNRRINWYRKPERLKKDLESDISFFHNLAVEFLHENEVLCPVLYAKLQKHLQFYLQVQRDNLIDFIHSLLSRDIRGYGRNRSIDELDLSSVPKEAYKEFIKQFEYHEIIKLFENIGISSNTPNNISGYSIFLKIKFVLRKLYMSRDDEDFYVIDNPVVKEKVFKTPYIRSTTWKGALRSVVKYLAPDFEVRLFGNEKESEESKQGRLFFFSTFLNGIGLDVITPLDRIKKAPVRGPILLEVVPEGYGGEFRLIYLPFDLIGELSSEKEEDRQAAFKEIKDDLEILKEAIPKMMLEYGFSAKKTSGYGVVEDNIEFWVNDRHGRGTFNNFKEEMKRTIASIGDRND